MYELKTCYDLDEALKLYSLHLMAVDIESMQAEELTKDTRKGKRR